MADLGFALFNALQTQVQLILVIFGSSFVFGAAIGQDAQQWYSLFLKEGEDTIIQNVCGSDGSLARIQLGKSHPAVGVNEGLLIYPAYPLDIANVIRVLGTQIAGVFGLDLAVGFTLLPLSLQSNHLCLGQDDPILRHAGFQGL